MDWIAEYLLSITAAAIICVAVKYIPGNKSTAGNMISIVAGVFMLITVLSPLLNKSFRNLEEYFADFYFSGDDVALSAAEEANTQLREIIKQQAEAYIMEETTRMSLSVSIEVNVANTEPPVPNFITISGNVSPYNKAQLTGYIADNLGIAQENIRWN